jgi:hypothetical protein
MRGRCLALEPCGLFYGAHVSWQASTVSLHRLEQLTVADQDHGSEEREHEYGIAEADNWHRRLTRLAGHPLLAGWPSAADCKYVKRA